MASITTSPRKRLSPEESRIAALEAARDLLLEAGPQAVTLKAVAARVGRTHANLLHHFGSAGALQKALAGHLARRVTATIGDAARRAREGDQNPREVVDLTFDAFDRQGAGQLVSWMILTGNDDALDPILEAIHDLVEQLAEGHSDGETPIHEETLQLVLMALGDAMMGDQMAKALGLARGTARALATASLLGSRRGPEAR